VQGESDSAPWFLTHSQPRQHLESLPLTPQNGAPEDRPSLRGCLPSEPTERSGRLRVDTVRDSARIKYKLMGFMVYF
jgi:hypothetical protein